MLQAKAALSGFSVNERDNSSDSWLPRNWERGPFKDSSESSQHRATLLAHSGQIAANDAKSCGPFFTAKGTRNLLLNLNLANLYQSQGRYQEAEPLYQRALAISEQQLGPLHPHTATNLNNLAALYYTQGRSQEAEPLFRRALSIREQ